MVVPPPGVQGISVVDAAADYDRGHLKLSHAMTATGLPPFRFIIFTAK